jgi:hypothetical protein
VSTGLTNIEMTESDKAVLQPVVNRLAALTAVSTTRLVHNAIDEPVPDSLVGNAKKADLGDAYDQARQRLNSAEDHFRTVLTVLTRSDTLPNFSLFTLVRGAAVATVHARHLLDRTIDETTRLGRGLSARLQNQEQLRKVERGEDDLDEEDVPADKVLSPDEFFAERVKHLQERATVNGIVPIHDRNDNIIGFGERWPSDTDLFDSYMPGIGKLYFQYLSGYAHSLPWAQLPMYRAQPTDDPKVKLVPTDINVPVFAAVLKGALDLYDETIGLVLAYAGYPPMVWAEAKKA